MMKFTEIGSQNSEIVLNEKEFESIKIVSKGAYEITMSSGRSYLILANPYLDALFR